MERLATVFDVLEADAREDEERNDSSRAVAAARVRGQKFAKYVAAYGEDGLEGISEHLTQIANETAAEYGGDPETVRAAVVAMLKEGMPGPGEDSYQGERLDMGDGSPEASETGLDSVGSPKIDKSDLPESLRQEPIDVGSVRNPAERQSIQHDVADLGDTPGEGIEQARNDAVTKTVSVDEPIGSEQTGARTDTWSEAQQQAVASRAAKWSVPLE